MLEKAPALCTLLLVGVSALQATRPKCDLSVGDAVFVHTRCEHTVRACQQLGSSGSIEEATGALGE